MPGVYFNLSNFATNFPLLLTGRNLIIKTSVYSSQVKGGSSEALLPLRMVLYQYSAGPFRLYVTNSTTLPLGHLRVLRTLLVQSRNNCGSFVKGFPKKVGGFNLRNDLMVMFTLA